MGTLKKINAWKKKTAEGVDWSAVKKTLRIAQNTKILLHKGVFGGDFARAVAEGQDWLEGFINALDAQLKKEKGNAEEKPKAETTTNPEPAKSDATPGAK